MNVKKQKKEKYSEKGKKEERKTKLNKKGKGVEIL